MPVSFFLGANSADGFASLYDHIIDRETAHRVYILKGGPGSGKSSFMRQIGQQVSAAGQEAHYITCSADPDSLDGVIFPHLGVALLDGTMPHAVEPLIPECVDTLINLGQWTDTDALFPLRHEISSLIQQKKKPYESATRCLQTAKVLEDEALNLVITPDVIHKIERRTKGIIRREIRPAARGVIQDRFLSAITPKGLVCHFDTARTLCPRLYLLKDSYGLAHLMLAPMVNTLRQQNIPAYACYNPLRPGVQLESLLIPALGVGFLTTNDMYPYEGDSFRRVRLDACLDTELMQMHKQRLRFLNKCKRALLDEAVGMLAQAHTIHDELEAIYNPHIDFQPIYNRAEAIAQEIIALER